MINRITKDPETRRQEIVDMAKSLFEEQGIPKTSMAEIADKVGVTKGLLYYYFKSKDELVQAIVEQLTHGIDKSLTQIIIDPQLDFPRKFKAFIGAYFQTIAENPVIFSTTPTDPQLFNLVREQLTSVALRHAGHLLNQGVKLGLIDIAYPEFMLKLLIKGLADLYMEGIRDPQIYAVLIEQTLGMKHGQLQLA
jgi:AcrR family transcriptional regulator